MSTIAEFRIPASDTAMETTFERAPQARLELESSVSKTLPSIWVSGTTCEAIENAFAADDTIERFELVASAEDRLLYDVDSERGQYLYDELLSSGGSLLEASGVDSWWQFKMRFRTREHLVDTHETLESQGIVVDLIRVTDVTTVSTGNTRLTPEQHEALTAAFEKGYFKIPRQISMEELASDLGISHQALSERLRRAYGTLVDAEVQPVNEQTTD
ncbi:helix-turn-helix domain-containing protein [Natronosalvus halobius]|uniref:helix-turn-helix domain-containing protein n=1 Tax=Natronosalvus halobius TaxID=2953746 RepID=UPI0020A01989|nr:helix-turn-helix domain-containing protein [Natronosalvus halobius]USZ73036.1 helix-turn-helix domain-containing protein [Natronosalvus halobius]